MNLGILIVWWNPFWIWFLLFCSVYLYYVVKNAPKPYVKGAY